MRFRIPGSLEAEAAGGLLPAGPPGQQRVLAVLLLNANQAVPVTRLVDALWDAGPPATAAKQAATRYRGRASSWPQVGRPCASRRLVRDTGCACPRPYVFWATSASAAAGWD